MESVNKESRVEIKPMGSYMKTDDEGYVVNSASLEKIQEKWKPVIDDVVKGYKNFFGDKLKQVYVRGSVAKGEAVDGISDIDTFAYVDLPDGEIDNASAKKEIIESFEGKYSFVEGFEIGADPVERSGDDQIILNQSVCVYGEPLQVKKMKPGREMMLHAFALDSRMEKIEKFLSEEHTSERMKGWCVWMFKNILRSGFEITMDRSKRYTRDLYKCYEGFSEYYPEKESEMRAVLDLILNPSDDKDKILKVVNDIIPWLVEESKKYV